MLRTRVFEFVVCVCENVLFVCEFLMCVHVDVRVCANVRVCVLCVRVCTCVCAFASVCVYVCLRVKMGGVRHMKITCVRG